MPTCRICHNTEGNKTYLVREMQFGFRDEFEYFECDQCGCLQIREIPIDLSKYYPENYYSYRSAQPTSEYTKKGIRGYKERFIRDRITSYYLNRNTRLGAYLEKKSSLTGNYGERLKWMKLQRLNLGVSLKSRILDIGCGQGHLLREMGAQGFSNLTGIDPFIAGDIFYDNSVKILKKQLEDLDQKFDFIMLHHSFEHMPEPLAVLKKLRTLLNPKCYILIRIPVAGSYSWKKYGVNWFALDAPRHLHLHTPKSMKLLAAKVGLRIADVVFDSEGISTLASEQYLRDIPFMDNNSYFINPDRSMFSKEEFERFRKLDEELNKAGTADCAGFYLQE
jgi:2-polyprenyl-3-methyl-5-hydroxy-6-metoxy-1,4-benzoquinol methylase